jgi:CheY-like chemotaxis protein/HPt (histidine-containing phosphotransfer) domain-containing protein
MEVERVQVSPIELLNDVKSISEIKARENGIEFDVEYDFPLPELVLTDPVRLKQILINLIGNAIKFTEQGSVLIRLRCDSEREILWFDVKDTGIGLSADQQKALFTAFTQADRSTTRKYGGSGLGLHLSRQLAEKLGGDISVQSIEGEGSCFSVSIATGSLANTRFVDEYIAPSTIEPGLQVDEPGRLHGSILLAEDNADNQRLIKAYIKQVGADLTIVDNGQKAVSEAGARNYDLILMDMQMPVMDGVQAMYALRQQGYEGPVVFLSANATQADMERCQQAGCDDFLTKPIETARFYSVLRAYLQADIGQELTPLVARPIIDDPEINKLAEDFAADFSATLEDLKSRLEARDWDSLRGKVHDLKSVSGGLGYPEISDVAARAQFVSMQKDYTEMRRLMAEFEALERRIKLGVDF